jgi:hypothetical protein
MEVPHFALSQQSGDIGLPGSRIESVHLDWKGMQSCTHDRKRCIACIEGGFHRTNHDKVIINR